MLDTSAAGISALGAVFTLLSIVLVGLRFHMRKIQKAPRLPDDWLMVLAVITFIGFAICIWIMVKIKVIGYSSFLFTKAQIAATAEDSSKLQICCDIFSIVCLGCSKASALFFYKRIFCVKSARTTNIVVTTSIVVVACWVVTFEFLSGFQCHTHFAALWNGNYDKYCTISFPFLYGLAVSDVLLDVWILSLPIPLILRLHITPTKKLSIIGAFLLGLAGLGASIARLVIFVQIENLGPAGFARLDSQLLNTKSEYFVLLEAGMSILAVNMTSLWPIFAKSGPDFFVRSMRSMTSLASGVAKSSKNSDTCSDIRQDQSNQSYPDRLGSNASALSDTSNHQALYKSYSVADTDGVELAAYGSHDLEKDLERGRHDNEL